MVDRAGETKREAGATDRETRLKQALKSNLARRKAQAKARAADDEKTEEQ